MEVRDISEVKLFDRYGRCVGTAVPKSLTVNSMGDIEIECSRLDLPRFRTEILEDFYRFVKYDTFYRPSSKYLITNVIFNDPATIVFWADGSKTVVKCQEHEVYDPEKGLAMAIAKKTFGNKGNYYNTFKKWLPEEDIEEPVYLSAREISRRINEAARRMSKGMSKK